MLNESRSESREMMMMAKHEEQQGASGKTGFQQKISAVNRNSNKTHRLAWDALSTGGEHMQRINSIHQPTAKKVFCYSFFMHAPAPLRHLIASRLNEN
jgi:hypothetical protein